jgi:hypothetical protein
MALIENQWENLWENWDKLKEINADNDAYARECEIAEQDWKMEASKKWGQDIFWLYNPDLIAEMNAQIQEEEWGDINCVMQVEENEFAAEKINSAPDNYVVKLNNNDEIVDNKEALNQRKLWQQELSENAYTNLALNLDENIFDNNNQESWEQSVEKLLEQTEVQEENKERWFNMIYNEDFISRFYDADPKINQENKDFITDSGVQEDLSKILENFLLPSNINDFSNISDKDKIKVWVALDSAFDIQISKLLDNKVNYPLVTVEKMIADIHEWNPFEKIELYEELKQLVNNWEGISGKAMDKNKTAITKNIQNKLLIKIDIQSEELLKMLEKSNISKQESHNIKEELTQLEIIKDNIKSGEAISWSEEDIINEWSKWEWSDVQWKKD